MIQDEFAQQVRDLLDHLYDYDFIQHSPLADDLDPDGRLPPRERMRRLRSALLASLEELNPGSEVSLYSPRVRSNAVLNLHYVDRLTVQQVANELALSERQVYRDLRQAEQDLAQVLWNHLRWSATEQPSSDEVSRLDLALRELSRLPEDRRPLDVCSLLTGALNAVAKLALGRGIELPACAGTDLGTIRGDRQTARQVLVGTLSYLVQHTKPGTSIGISGNQQDGKVSLELRFCPDRDELAVPPVTAGLLERLGGEQRLDHLDPESAVLTLLLSDQRPYHVLVIDDNEGLIALFQRYLTGGQYRVTGARDGQDGLRLATAAPPDVIVLDVLMPGQDGWEVLDRLGEIEATRDIPVIVCSVLDSPALAFSLGASGYLSKPVSRQRLTEELARLCQDPPTG